jgi:hypothetical protein
MFIEKETSSINKSSEYTGKNIDIAKVKKYWIDLQNTERKSLGLTPFSYDDKLDITALKWSQNKRDAGTIDHKVSPGDSYYDYWKKADWMKDNGVVCTNIDRVTFSESIGWGHMSCKDDECTDELNTAIKSTFDFFMSEK